MWHFPRSTVLLRGTSSWPNWGAGNRKCFANRRCILWDMGVQCASIIWCGWCPGCSHGLGLDALELWQLVSGSSERSQETMRHASIQKEPIIFVFHCSVYAGIAFLDFLVNKQANIFWAGVPPVNMPSVSSLRPEFLVRNVPTTSRCSRMHCTRLRATPMQRSWQRSHRPLAWDFWINLNSGISTNHSLIQPKL